MEILTDINRGRYTPGSFCRPWKNGKRKAGLSQHHTAHPFPAQQYRGHKVRKRARHQILHKNEISENCDLTQPAVRRRLSDYAQSLQILLFVMQRGLKNHCGIPGSGGKASVYKAADFAAAPSEI